VCPNSQDVGLEAAIIARVRNSSLVECTGADNVARLKHRPEAVDCLAALRCSQEEGRREEPGNGRGAFSEQRSPTARTGGAQRRANAGMSSVISVETRDTASLRVPGQRQSTQGQSGPKPRTTRRRRWKAGQIVLHHSPSLSVKRGRGREGEPSKWTGWAACLEVRVVGKAATQKA